MKHVSESLNQYYDFKFFKILEEDNKSELQDKEKDGLAVVEKLKKNFEDFRKDANGKISAYKTFWEENQTTKQAFIESGNIYKLFNSDYVVGVLELPVQTLSDGSLDGGLGADGEPEEEIIEGPEIESNEEPVEDFFEEQQVPTNEAEEGEDIDLDLDSSEDEGDDLDLDAPEENVEGAEDAEEDIDMDMEVNTDSGMEEPVDYGDSNLTTPQNYFVVYELSNGEREEILRCGSNNVVNAFNEFFNDTFKSAMKNVIVKYKEAKQLEKKEAEQKVKEKQESEKESKIKKFLGESKRNY